MESKSSSAFDQLKSVMCSTPVLKLLDFFKPFIIEIDASDQGMWAILMHEGHPIAFISKALSARHMGYSVMALVMAVTKWRYYLIGHHFIIHTNHQSLKFFLDQRLTTNLQYKWLTRLLGLDYEIKYKKRVENKVADALSTREHDPQEAVHTLGSLLAISTVQPKWIQELQMSYERDSNYQNIISQLILDDQQ